MFEIIIYILLILSLIYGFYFLIMASGVFRKKKCEIDNNKKNHFEHKKNHACIIEKRLDDTFCTQETVLKDNARYLKLAKKYNVNYILINEDYEKEVDL